MCEHLQVRFWNRLDGTGRFSRLPTHKDDCTTYCFLRLFKRNANRLPPSRAASQRSIIHWETIKVHLDQVFEIATPLPTHVNPAQILRWLEPLRRALHFTLAFHHIVNALPCSIACLELCKERFPPKPTPSNQLPHPATSHSARLPPSHHKPTASTPSMCPTSSKASHSPANLALNAPQFRS